MNTQKPDGIMVPLALEILVHYNQYGCDFRDGDFSATAVRGWLDQLHAVGLLERAHRGIGRNGVRMLYQLSDRGYAHVEAICRLPLPVQKWLTPGLDLLLSDRQSK